MGRGGWGAGPRFVEEGPADSGYDPMPKWEPQKAFDLAENHIDFTDAA